LGFLDFIFKEQAEGLQKIIFGVSMNDNYPVIVKSYELTLWYLKKIEKLQVSLLELLKRELV